MWIYIIIASVIAIAIVNKTKCSNWSLLGIVPALAVGVWIAWSVAGVVYHYLLIPLLAVGVIVAVVLYIKKKAEAQ